jgi:phosphate transport system protein
MQTHFEQEISDLKQRLLTMASHAEKAVRDAVDSVMRRDENLATEVQVHDEVLDSFEVELDELAIKLLAKAPLASDLRLIAVSMKVTQNLERVGDEASKIAKRSRELMQQPPLPEMDEIPPLARMSLDFLKHALDCFVSRDAAAARALIPRDKEIDAANRKIYCRLAELMAAAPETIGRCLSLIVVAKSLERIADHGKNIAEEVVYLCEAEDIRHQGQTNIPRP